MLRNTFACKTNTKTISFYYFNMLKQWSQTRGPQKLLVQPVTSTMYRNIQIGDKIFDSFRMCSSFFDLFIYYLNLVSSERKNMLRCPLKCSPQSLFYSKLQPPEIISFPMQPMHGFKFEALLG